MLMDDTFILPTSREKLTEKLKLLDEYCTTSGMLLDESKTDFMVMNGSPMDKTSFVLSNTTIKHYASYIYLGVIFTSDGRCASALLEHLSNKCLRKRVAELFACWKQSLYVSETIHLVTGKN